MARVDVVVVSYNSRRLLRRCVEPLAGLPGVRVVVVDNASPEPCLDVLEGLPVSVLALPRNGGFAAGCNAGWRAGEAPFVLFLNPDATLDPASLRRLARVLADDAAVGAVGPRLLERDGSVARSQRRFPGLRSTYAQALFLHRLLPRLDELVRGRDAYERPGSPDWISGACVLTRRALLERLGGLDERFFLYCEDTDLCRRIRDLGYDVRYEPGATALHEGGGSAPRPALLPVLAASRVRYARKHAGRTAALVEGLGVALGALTHLAVGRGGRVRRGHARSLRTALAEVRP